MREAARYLGFRALVEADLGRQPIDGAGEQVLRKRGNHRLRITWHARNKRLISAGRDVRAEAQAVQKVVHRCPEAGRWS